MQLEANGQALPGFSINGLQPGQKVKLTADAKPETGGLVPLYVRKDGSTLLEVLASKRTGKIATVHSRSFGPSVSLSLDGSQIYSGGQPLSVLQKKLGRFLKKNGGAYIASAPGTNLIVTPISSGALMIELLDDEHLRLAWPDLQTETGGPNPGVTRALPAVRPSSGLRP